MKINYKNLILKYFSKMFKVNLQYSKNIPGTLLNCNNQGLFVRQQGGYNNYDSPMKTAFKLQTSPRKSLSPIKRNGDVRSGMNRSKSPILLSRRDQQYSSNRKVSPFKRQQTRTYNEEHQSPVTNISFKNLIRKNSNGYGNNKSVFKAMQYSTTSNASHNTLNYLQSDRNFREDTGLFRKLASMLESNKSNKSFINSEINDNSLQYKPEPQSCRNASNYNSNKKVFIKNVATIQSIQSPEDRDFIEQAQYYADLKNIETKCYSEYEKMTTIEAPPLQKKSSNTYNTERVEPQMVKKQSSKKSAQNQQEQLLSFKKITFANEKAPVLNNDQGRKPIDFHLTNSFGTTINLKSQITGEKHAVKTYVNPFEQILSSQVKQSNPQIRYLNNDAPFNQKIVAIENSEMDVINRSMSQSRDSVFASLQMLLDKVNEPQGNGCVHKQNQSINISIMSDSYSELDMEPFFDRNR